MDAITETIEWHAAGVQRRRNAALRQRLEDATFEQLMRELAALEGFNVAARMDARAAQEHAAENLQKAPIVG